MHSPTTFLPCSQLLEILLPAYEPCANFGKCREAKWNPATGQIPRGFLGATGLPEDVEVVMIFSQPGDPHDNEYYAPKLTQFNLMLGGLNHTYECFAEKKDKFHENVRWFIDELYPACSFDEQLRHVWLTEGRLCSFENEISTTTDRTCAREFLSRQLDLFPEAEVVAFGRKAQGYLDALRVGYIEAYSLAPPGANHKPARPSWEAAIRKIQMRRSSV